MAEITGRERDTILAALESWANSGDRNNVPETKKYCYRSGPPLERHEVQALIQKLGGVEAPRATEGE
jgi:hypothetical protein